MLTPIGTSLPKSRAHTTRDVHQGLDVRVGDDDHPLVPAGLMLGVRMMAEGQGCVVRCAAKYGYGGEGWRSYCLHRHRVRRTIAPGLTGSAD